MKTPLISPRDQICNRCNLFFSALLVLFLGGLVQSNAQTDNFDSGSLSSAWTKYEFFPQTYTFPNNSNGKALRIQTLPAGGGVPAAAMIAQTNIYTDFYMAFDIVNWDATKDQALVMCGRWTPAGFAGLFEATGMIMNWDVNQDGENVGDRRGGQLQINQIYPGFTANTIAAAELTLELGRSYRFIFKAVGTFYTATVYDTTDLINPLVTIYADDAVYGSGQCGFLSFSRYDDIGTTDVTLDNYYAAAADPNTATLPVIQHSISGTPIVDSRVPAARWSNFVNPATPISFTAKTFTADVINASATKLYLNNVDVSSQLNLPANSSSIAVSLAAGVVQPNTVYSARIELADVSGLKKSTNLFWFDTFTQSLLASGAFKTVEIEDYNYSNGVYQLDPIPVSGIDTNGSLVNGSLDVGGNGLGYFGMTGTPGIDFFKPGGTYRAVFSEYRGTDRAQITQGSYMISTANDEAGDILDFVTNVPPARIHSSQRSQYQAAKVWEYQVKLTSPDDWFNYTRSFANSNYYVMLRCSSLGSTTVHLDQVTSDPTVGSQTTSRLGSFNIGNNIMRLNYRYELLMNGSTPAIIPLSGLKTLRLTIGGTVSKDDRLINLDYLVFIPTANLTPTLGLTKSGGNALVSWPLLPYRLQSASSLTGVWTDVFTSITQSGGINSQSSPATGNKFFRLVYP